MKPSEAKRTLRAHMKQQRALRSEAQRIQDAHAICAHWFVEPRLQQRNCIALYYPLGAEISPLPLMQMLAQQHRPLALPAVTTPNAPLQFFTYHPDDPLILGKHGIHEPAQQQHPIIPDTLVIPLLAIDRHGVRMGYGGGYYDRTLAHLHQMKIFPLSIGLAYHFQIVETLEAEPHDEALDGVLTPEGMMWF